MTDDDLDRVSRRAMLAMGLAAAASPGLAAARLKIIAVNQPLADFADRLGGDRVEVIMPAPPGADPARWTPAETDLAVIRSGDLMLANGAGYAPWTGLVPLPRTRTVQTSRNFAGRYISAEAGAGLASHTWLDFSLAAMQAETIASALKVKIPEAGADISRRRTELLSDLSALHLRAQAAAVWVGDRRLFSSRPVYQYFARAYGLEIESVGWEAGAAPDARAWSMFDALHGRSRALMLWDSEPLPQVRSSLAERGVKPVVFDPGGGASPVRFVPRMNANLEELEAALSSA